MILGKWLLYCLYLLSFNLQLRDDVLWKAPFSGGLHPCVKPSTRYKGLFWCFSSSNWQIIVRTILVVSAVQMTVFYECITYSLCFERFSIDSFLQCYIKFKMITFVWVIQNDYFWDISCFKLFWVISSNTHPDTVCFFCTQKILFPCNSFSEYVASGI